MQIKIVAILIQMNFRKKYIKYKTKYINLKQTLYGGNMECPRGPEIDNRKYTVQERLGSGASGVVCKVKDENTYALKSENVNKNFLNEIAVLRKLSEPICNKHIVCMYGHNDESGYLLTEYISGETLDKLNYTPELAIDYAVQIAKGLKYMHDKNIVHADIKPNNIMLSKNGIIKILDFGFACIENTKKCANTFHWIYSPPERIINKNKLPYDNIDDFKKTDIYSFGLVLFYMFNNKTYPYTCGTSFTNIRDWLTQKMQDDDIYSSKIHFDTNLLCNSGIPEIDALIKKCLSVDPNIRPTIDEILKELTILQIKMNRSTDSKEEIDEYMEDKSINNQIKKELEEEFKEKILIWSGNNDNSKKIWNLVWDNENVHLFKDDNEAKELLESMKDVAYFDKALIRISENYPQQIIVDTEILTNIGDVVITKWNIEENGILCNEMKKCYPMEKLIEKINKTAVLLKRN